MLFLQTVQYDNKRGGSGIEKSRIEIRVLSAWNKIGISVQGTDKKFLIDLYKYNEQLILMAMKS